MKGYSLEGSAHTPMYNPNILSLNRNKHVNNTKASLNNKPTENLTIYFCETKKTKFEMTKVYN